MALHQATRNILIFLREYAPARPSRPLRHTRRAKDLSSSCKDIRPGAVNSTLAYRNAGFRCLRPEPETTCLCVRTRIGINVPWRHHAGACRGSRDRAPRSPARPPPGVRRSTRVRPGVETSHRDTRGGMDDQAQAQAPSFEAQGGSLYGSAMRDGWAPGELVSSSLHAGLRSRSLRPVGVSRAPRSNAAGHRCTAGQVGRARRQRRSACRKVASIVALEPGGEARRAMLPAWCVAPCLPR